MTEINYNFYCRILGRKIKGLGDRKCRKCWNEIMFSQYCQKFHDVNFMMCIHDRVREGCVKPSILQRIKRHFNLNAS